MKKLIAFAVFPLLVFACSGSSHDEDGSVRAFVADYCDAYMPCCAAASLPTDGVECRRLMSAFTSGDFGIDEDAASECSAWLETLNGTDFCQGAVTPVAACGNVFTPKGNRAPGQSCDTFGDCAPSSEGDVRCLGEPSGEKRCQLIIEGAEGSAPCAWSDRGSSSTSSANFDLARVYSCNAADGLYCDDNSCAPISPAGSGCVESRECELESYCSDDGICAPQFAAGSVCEYSEQCSQGSCVDDVCVGNVTSTLLCGGEL